MDHWGGSSLESENVAETLVALHQRLCDVEQAINLSDPVLAPANRNKDADLTGQARGLNEIMHAPVYHPCTSP